MLRSMRQKLLCIGLCCSLSGFAQLRTIYAIAGDGLNVDWAAIKRNSTEEGYFYNPCDQGVQPFQASSTLKPQGSKSYYVQNLNDHDPMTAWVEGANGYGIGEYFEIKAPSVTVIYNGYQSSPKSWLENSRVKTFKVYRNGTPLCFLELKDEMGGQFFELPDHKLYDPSVETTYRFEIFNVFKGTQWSDVAVSEIDLRLCCFSASTSIFGELNHFVPVTDLKEGAQITSIDINTGTLQPTEVIKTTSQRHVSLLKINCDAHEIEVTGSHPLYIKGIGFSSISQYMAKHNITEYADLVGVLELWVWDASIRQPVFKKLTGIEFRQGVFDTYSISQLSKGSAFIANGFITKAY